MGATSTSVMICIAVLNAMPNLTEQSIAQPTSKGKPDGSNLFVRTPQTADLAHPPAMHTPHQIHYSSNNSLKPLTPHDHRQSSSAATITAV